MATMPASDITKFKGASDAPVPDVLRMVIDVADSCKLIYRYETDGPVPGYAPTLVEVMQDQIEIMSTSSSFKKFISGQMTQRFHFEEDHPIECLEPAEVSVPEDEVQALADATWDDIVPIAASTIPPPIGAMNMTAIIQAMGIPPSITRKEEPEKPKMKPVPEKRGRRIILE